jgi:hypothetical protein
MSFIPPMELGFAPSAQKSGALAPPPGHPVTERPRRWSVGRQLLVILLLLVALVTSALLFLQATQVPGRQPE